MAERKSAGGRNSGMNIDSKLVRELAELLNETGLTEIEVEDNDRKIRVARGGVVASAAPAQMVAAPAPTPATAPAAAAPAPAAEAAPADDHGDAVKSPANSNSRAITSKVRSKPCPAVGKRGSNWPPISAPPVIR